MQGSSHLAKKTVKSTVFGNVH